VVSTGIVVEPDASLVAVVVPVASVEPGALVAAAAVVGALVGVVDFESLFGHNSTAPTTMAMPTMAAGGP
jgi:hypothetical protein